MKPGGRLHYLEDREFPFGAALLALYAVALFLPDPEWVMWAGSMAVGALPQEVPPSLPYAPAELLSGAGTLGIIALIALAALSLLTGWRTWRRPIVKPCTSSFSARR